MSLIAMYLAASLITLWFSCVPGIQQVPWPKQAIEGSYVIESSIRHYAPAGKELRAVSNHLKQIRGRQYVGRSPAEREWLLERGLSGARVDWVPSALRAVRSRDLDYYRTEYVLGGPETGYRVDTLGVVDGVDSVHEHVLLLKNGERVAWSGDEGSPQAAHRSWSQGFASSMGGTILLVDRVMRDADFVWNHGKTVSSDSDDNEEFRSVDFTDVAVASAIPFLPLAAVDTGREVQLRWSRDERALDLDWIDVEGRSLLREELKWDRRVVGYPSAYSFHQFLPGTHSVLVEGTTEIMQVSREASKAVEWVQRPGQTVVDARFLIPLTLHVGDEGLPSDEDLMRYAEVEYAERAASIKEGGGSVVYEASGQLHELCNVVFDRAVIGKLALGDRTRVRFQVENTTEESLRVEDVDVDCGCTDVSITPRVVGPGDSCRIAATQQATELGSVSAGFRLRLHGENGESEIVPFTVSYTGIARPWTRPAIIDLGRVTPGSEESIPFSFGGDDASWDVRDAHCVIAGVKGTVERLPESGEDVAALADFRIPDALGRGGCEVYVRAAGKELADGVVHIRWNAAPPEVIRDWPSCVVVLDMNAAEDSATMSFPKTAIEGIVGDNALAGLGIDVRVDDQDRSTVEFKKIPGASTRQVEGVLVLESDRGQVRVEVFVTDESHPMSRMRATGSLK